MGKRLARMLGWTLLWLLLIALGTGAVRWHAVVARLHDYAGHHPCEPVTWWLQEHVPELEPLPRANCPPPAPSPEMQALQAENARLTQQLQDAARERDRLQDILKDGDHEPKFAVNAEGAVAVALKDGIDRSQYLKAKSVTLVEFRMPDPPRRWVAVWKVELVSSDGLIPEGNVVVDAFTGKRLNASNAPTGQ